MSGFGWDGGRTFIIATVEQWGELIRVCQGKGSMGFVLTMFKTER